MNSKEYEGLNSDLMVLVNRIIKLEEKMETLLNKHLRRIERR